MHKWEQRVRPVRLERRFEFETYSETRDFLDRLGKHSEIVKKYPDISFGKTYVNVTLRPEDEEEGAQLTDSDHKFASEIDEFIG